MSSQQPAASAFLQVALRQRWVDVKQALALRHVLAGCGDDPQAVAKRVRENPTALAPAVTRALIALLPTNDQPTISPYRRLARLGEGRLGITWLALGNVGLVAIKEFHPSLLSSAAQAQGLRADLDLLIGGGHRYLVNYLAVASASDGHLALVQEYRQGRDVSQRAAARGGSSEARALTILRQAAKGLAVLHHGGHCHGHLHPGNILLDADGRAALGDYALTLSAALKAVRPGWSAQALGRHPWVAPEEIPPTSQPSVAGDIYTLGCIGYWLLAGEPPFPGTVDQQILQHQNAARPDVRRLAEGVSELTAKTLLKAMQVDPAQRYHDARSLVHSLERNLDELDQARVATDKLAAPTGHELPHPEGDHDDSGKSSLMLLEPE